CAAVTLSMRLAPLPLLEVVAVIDVAVPGARAVLGAGDRVPRRIVGRIVGRAAAVAGIEAATQAEPADEESGSLEPATPGQLMPARQGHVDREEHARQQTE